MALPTTNLVAQWETDHELVLDGSGNAATWDDKIQDQRLVDNGTPPMTTTPTGEDAILFVGNEKMHQPNTAMAFLPQGNTARTIAVVARLDRFDFRSAFVEHGVSSTDRSFGIGIDNSGNLTALVWGNDVASTVDADDGAWRVLIATHDGTTVRLYDGTTEIASATRTLDVPTDLSSHDFRIGTEVNNGEELDGAVAAVLMYDAALDTTDRADLDDYLRAKYLSSGPEGVANLPVNVALAATGRVDAEGSTDLPVGVALAAQGSTDAQGVGDLPVGLAIAATGAADAAGTGDLPITITLAATGSAPGGGTADLPVGVALAAAGQTGAEGTGALALDVALAATGSTETSGSTDLPIGIALAASGQQPGLGGTADLPIGLALAATGDTESAGTAGLGFALTLAATGSADGGGTADLPVDVALAASGQTTAAGVADLPISLALAATGQAPAVSAAEGTADLPVAVALAATGQAPNAGTAAFVLVLSLAARSIFGTHPEALASSDVYSVNVLAAPDGQTVMAVSNGSVVRYWAHPGWTTWAGDPNDLVSP